MNDQLDIVQEFLVESSENLDQLDRDLLALEQEPSSQPTLHNIFRTIHTIKGTCGFLGFGKLESVAHAGESLLSKLRDGELSLRPEIMTGLLALVDAVREILGNIETAGSEGEAEYSELVQTLLQAAGGLEPSGRGASQPIASEPGAGAPVASGRVAGQDETPTRNGSAFDRTIRVDVGLLDKLMNVVGELVLARNQMLRFTSQSRDAGLLSTSQRLSAITTELQEGVMKTRLQPIGKIWSKLPRVVRDLAAQCGKRARIEMDGKETELDKTIVEAIKDPLTHLIRNAIDHGIERPERRTAAGKPPEGCLRLRAFHEGGQVNIEIADDGGGLDIDLIRRKAVERKLVSPEEGRRMSDRAIGQLIFAPSFSTAAAVTNVSGRGVGMDVVKTNVEKIGGTLDLQSQPGVGTTVKLKIPLTLAIIPALIVTCDGERYAIAQVSLLELVRPRAEEADKRIESIHGAPVYRLRGQLLPLVHLRRELQANATPPAGGAECCAADGDNGRAVCIVVLKADQRQFGLVVDEVNDTEEIVVKPLASHLKNIPVYAGATIMGDGRIALILDVLGIAQRAAILSGDRSTARAEPKQQAHERAADRLRLLVLTVGKRRLALPISVVERLEVVPPRHIEWADGQDVIQYRGEILPLLWLGKILGLPTLGLPPTEPSEGALRVVVCQSAGSSVGLVVDQIEDVVETAVEVRREARTSGLRASVVIDDQVTDLVDLPAVMRQAGLPAESHLAEIN